MQGISSFCQYICGFSHCKFKQIAISRRQLEQGSNRGIIRTANSLIRFFFV